MAKYARSIGLPANFFYATYSQDESTWMEMVENGRNVLDTYRVDISTQTKTSENVSAKKTYSFRLVWALEDPISPGEYEQIYRTLLDSTFDGWGPDKSTKDVSRLWFGGRLGSVLLSEEPLAPAALGWASTMAKVGDGREARKAVRCKGGLIPRYAEGEPPATASVSGAWWERLRGRCGLWDAYERGRYLDYNQRLMLFTNLKYLHLPDNNRSLLEDVMGFYRPEVWKGHTFDREQLARILRDRTLRPLPCVDMPDGTRATVAEFFAGPAGPARPSVERVPLQELDAWLDENVPVFLSSPGPGYLRAQTGCGKTERIARFLAECDTASRKVIYSAPMHANLREFERRYRALGGGECHRLPEQPLSKADSLLLQLGLSREGRSSERGEFLDRLFDPGSAGLFLLTHQMLANLGFASCDLIIIDEGPEDSLIRQKKASLASLAGLYPLVDAGAGRTVLDFVDGARELPYGSAIDMGTMARDVAPQLEALVRSRVAGGQPVPAGIPEGFFSIVRGEARMTRGGAVCSMERSPLVGNALDRGTPVKILTATPKGRMLANHYGEEVPLRQAPLASNAGRIVQYRGLSGAKGRDFSRLPDMAKYIRSRLPREVIEQSYLISFKGSEGFWREQGFRTFDYDGAALHMRNNAGLDCLKGKSLIVAGKYDFPDEKYDDEWAFIGDGSEVGRQTFRVEVGGVSQAMYLVDKAPLREEQIEDMQAVAQQTVGRARCLRCEGATVYLFSNLPDPDADEIYD